MRPFTIITEVAAPLEIPKVDTGMILPGRYMRRHRRPGHDYGEAFLHDLRFDEKDEPRVEFVLNRPDYRDAKILITDSDFGCGSSREGAVFAVLDYGILALVGMSFGEIFQINCIQNGILAITLSEKIIRETWRQLHQRPGAKITIDLPNQSVITPDGALFGFEISPLRKHRLLRGMDDVDVTLQHLDEIERFEAMRRAAMPWLPGTRASMR